MRRVVPWLTEYSYRKALPVLVGIVVTNAIVLLGFVTMLRREHGYSTYDALVEGAQTRVRPILMTAVAAMLALIPLTPGRNQGALIASELGRVVIGGLFSSTLLTLVVVPVVFSLVDGLKMRFSHQPSTVAAELASVAGSDPRGTLKQ